MPTPPQPPPGKVAPSPVEVLPASPEDEMSEGPKYYSSGKSSKSSFAGLLPQKKTFYHPLSGLLILGVDFIAFGSEITTGMLDLIPCCILSFIITFLGVFLIQRRVSEDRDPSALGKAFLGAFLAGLPFSISGTILGAGVILLSGLPNPKDALKLFMPKS